MPDVQQEQRPNVVELELQEEEEDAPQQNAEMSVIDMHPPPISTTPTDAARQPFSPLAPLKALFSAFAPRQTQSPTSIQPASPKLLSSEQARDLLSYLSPTPRTPVLCTVDYGISGAFAHDLWSLLHNALRMQLFETYEILTLFREHADEIVVRDVQCLRDWFMFVGRIWDVYIAHDSQSLTPVIKRIVSIDGRSDILTNRLSTLHAMREMLCLKFLEARAYIDELDISKPARGLGLFMHCFDVLCERMVGYFAGVERTYPTLVEGYHGMELLQNIERSLVERIQPDEQLLVAIARGAGAGREMREWLSRYDGWGRTARWIRVYESGHANVLKYFRERTRTLGRASQMQA